MSFGYVTIDGERVEAHVAADFHRMNQEFNRVWRLWLRISSGTRTTAEQAYLYNGWINRLPGFNLAAPPGQSNHEEGGPIGPRALDLRDTGPDAGVTVIGSARSNWLAANCGRFNFKNAGHYFNPREGWHYEWTGSFAGVGYDGGTPIDQDVQNRQNWLNATRGEQLEPDGILGPKTIDAIKRYQEFLRGYGYTGAIDGVWGPGTTTAHEKFWHEWHAAHQPQPGGVPAFPLPAGKWFGPEGGGDNSISGWHSYNAELRVWQQRMKDRGWQITVDGLYGPKGATTPQGETAAVAKAFQAEKGLTVDGLIGPETWKAAWTSPVTPANPAPPAPAPTPAPAPAPSVPVPPTAPVDGYVPTREENPRGLPVVPKTYPGAKYALQAPLGDGVRGFKGDPPEQVELVVDRAIEHWTGTDVLQYDWFSYKNSRSSAPNWYILPNGDVVEFIPFEAKPALTGPQWNWRSVGWEIQKTPNSEGTPEQFEAVCRILAWLASLNGTTYRGVPVRFSLDREHFLNHREALPGTECPGEWWAARMDAQLDRARAIFAEEYADATQPQPPAPEPTPTPTPEPPTDTITVERAFLANLRDNLLADVEEIARVLGG